MSDERLSETGSRLLREVPVLMSLRRHDPRGVDEILRIVESCAEFNRLHAEPVALELDSRMEKDPEYFDWDLARAACRYRLFSLVIPAVMGGLAGRYMLTAGSLAFEELCSTCAGIGNMIAASSLGASPMLTPGGMPHWDTVLHEMLEGEKRGEPVLMAYAITEPSAGTDVEEPRFLARARIGMEARKVRGGYLLNGRKCFISGGKEAKYLTVCAATDRERPLETWTVFLVHRDMEGFSVPRVEPKMGQRACHAAEILFEDVFVPDTHVMGYEGDGMSTGILTIMAASRGPVGAVGTGIARGVCRHFLAWARERRNGSRPLDEQHIRMAAADMVAAVQESRGLVLNHSLTGDAVFGRLLVNPLMKAIFALPREVRISRPYQAYLHSRHGKATAARLLRMLVSEDEMTRLLALASLAKFACTDNAVAVASRALELMGADGSEERRWVEKCYRDAKVTQIYEGTNQLNRLTYHDIEIGGDLRVELPRPR
ncbi:MAG: acyl-CoA/acyl-ACP dehydrogenase [Actinobacteria bacterium]|nr:acyl-CoA/acyl-ACP dehydrogenase [Actinomycetota bacterium]